MRAGIDKHFGRIGVVLGLAAEPCTAMDKREYWCIGTRRAVDVELLRLGRTISFAPRRPKPHARQLAAARLPTDDLGLQGRVETLVIGRIEFDLIHVHPCTRTFILRRWPDGTHGCRRLS